MGIVIFYIDLMSDPYKERKNPSLPLCGWPVAQTLLWETV